MKSNRNKKFALIWKSGGYIIGADWVVAKHYLKSINSRIGLIEVSNQLIYSIKDNSGGSWQACRAIKRNSNHTINRQNALRDYFYSYLLTNQSNFTILELKN